MQVKEIPYWIALAHIQKWRVAKINALTDRFLNEEKISIEDFFHLDENKWKSHFGLTTPDVTTLINIRSGLTKIAFLAENLLNEGYEILPQHSPDYSPLLKEHLGLAHAPVILYTKGNRQLMKKPAVAIVGSRGASEIALNFTDNIVRRSVKESKIVISGFARGIDKKALDSAVGYKGQSIIVLGQGILTFTAGYRAYYRHVTAGDVLIASTFPPEVPWLMEFAMARNPIIYGMANDIYVAESSKNGGTWAGVMDGFRKKRIIYVRNAGPGENNVNSLLIQKGAIPVDFDGKEIMKQINRTLFD